MFHGTIPQEITLPDGVPVGEVVVYDESRGVNLFGNMQNASEQDQITALIQQMNMPPASPTMNSTPVNGVPAFNQQTPRVNLPVTEAETRMRQFQLRSAQGEGRGARDEGRGNILTPHPSPLIPSLVPSSAFDVMGKLGRVNNLGDDSKKYALVDSNGKTVCLVTPTPGVALEPFVGQTVGLIGIWGVYARGDDSFRQISAKAVYPVVKE